MARARAAAPPSPPAPPGAPDPRRVILSSEINAPNRRLDCAYYGKCLNEAVRRNWPGFSCRACTVTLISADALARRP